MGLLDGTTQQAYNDGTNKGNYQFVSLDDIIKSFMLVYVGENKIINKANYIDVQFHGMRAVQELSYDVLRSHKAYEQTVPATLVMYLPQDYVNYTKIVRIDSNGIEKPLYPTGKTSNPFPIKQNADDAYVFLGNGTIGEDPSNHPDSGGNATNPRMSDTRNSFNSIPTSNSNQDYDALDHNRLDNRGRRYGLDPQHAQQNGTFYIDNDTGFIHFSSDLAGETVTLKYISDGLGTDSEMIVHKFCEEAVYKHIMYALVSGRSNMPQGVIQRFKKEKFAETRKAKIRLSNIKMEEFTQVLKGISKPIK
tara:strand:- start:257 stop:1174 length:918 start_codon:yes stop_codon:yes gene_type:complete